MEIWTVLTAVIGIVGGVIATVAGVVQVMDYVQKRREKAGVATPHPDAPVSIETIATPTPPPAAQASSCPSLPVP